MFHKKVEKKIHLIKHELTQSGSLGTEMLNKALKSIEEKKLNLAEEVIHELEPSLNDLEIEIEKNCINILALHKLQVINLRSIIMFIKMNDDLERIGDLGTGIAILAKKIIEKKSKLTYSTLEKIASLTYEILLKANQSFKNQDIFVAYEVLKMDKEINNQRNKSIKSIYEAIKKNKHFGEVEHAFIKVVEKLERIGDLSKNIAEEVIYIVSGDMVKHGKKQ